MPDLLASSLESLSWEAVLLSLLLAYLLSQWIAGLYCWTYRGLSYSRGMVQALALAGILAALLMMAIGNNLARGIGIVGTMALIRFRTNLRDPWDMVFVFAVFAVGIACGTLNFKVAIAGTLVFTGATLVLYKSGFGARLQHDGLLRVQLPAAPEAQQGLEAVLRAHCRSFVLVTLRELGQGAEQEHAYQVRLLQPSDQVTLLEELARLPGARAVSLQMQEATVEL